MSDTDWLTWPANAICVKPWAMFVVCSSDENCAIWPMKSWLFMGFDGSWFWSWTARSFRNESLPSTPLGFVGGAELVPPVLPVAEVDWMLMRARPLGRRRAGGS